MCGCFPFLPCHSSLLSLSLCLPACTEREVLGGPVQAWASLGSRQIVAAVAFVVQRGLESQLTMSRGPNSLPSPWPLLSLLPCAVLWGHPVCLCVCKCMQAYPCVCLYECVCARMNVCSAYVQACLWSVCACLCVCLCVRMQAGLSLYV
jgi:hypothetical protein